jgi:hypothetical protein
MIALATFLSDVAVAAPVSFVVGGFAGWLAASRYTITKKKDS